MAKRLNVNLERMKKEEKEHRSLQELYNTPANLRLKYAAIAVIAVAIVLFMVMIIWHDDITVRTKLFMRGCAGLAAIIFAILVGILVYRVNSAFIKQQ